MTDKAYVTERKPTPIETKARRAKFRRLWSAHSAMLKANHKTLICSKK